MFLESLKDARERREELRTQLANSIDPGATRKAKKAARTERAPNSFEVIASEWFAKHSPNWADSHSGKIIQRLEKDVFPWLGGRAIAEISAPEVLAALRRIEGRGALDTAHRVHQNCGQVSAMRSQPDGRCAIPAATCAVRCRQLSTSTFHPLRNPPQSVNYFGQ